MSTHTKEWLASGALLFASTAFAICVIARVQPAWYLPGTMFLCLLGGLQYRSYVLDPIRYISIVLFMAAGVAMFARIEILFPPNVEQWLETKDPVQMFMSMLLLCSAAILLMSPPHRNDDPSAIPTT